MILSKNGTLYSFRFGLKGLIMLNDLLYLNEDRKILIYYSGFITDQPNITLQEVKSLLKECSEFEINLLDNYIDKNFSFKSPLEIEELYTKTVGEMGIAPSDFYSMTLSDINLAYEGYLERIEVLGNIYLLALQMKNQNKASIHLREDRGYEIGNLIERKRVFQDLGIQED